MVWIMCSLKSSGQSSNLVVFNLHDQMFHVFLRACKSCKYVVDVVFSFFLHFIYALCFFIFKPDFCEGFFDTNLWNKVVRIFKLYKISNLSLLATPFGQGLRLFV